MRNVALCATLIHSFNKYLFEHSCGLLAVLDVGRCRAKGPDILVLIELSMVSVEMGRIVLVSGLQGDKMI
jgi:hypothetical protein